MKSYLFILRKPAHSGAFVQEMLDIILTTAAFDQTTGILLLDDAVFQLKNNQHPETGMKDTAAIFEALKIYDVKAVHVELESLQERGLSPSDLCLPADIVHRRDIAALMRRYEVLFPG